MKDNKQKVEESLIGLIEKLSCSDDAEMVGKIETVVNLLFKLWEK